MDDAVQLYDSPCMYTLTDIVVQCIMMIQSVQYTVDYFVLLCIYIQLTGNVVHK